MRGLVQRVVQASVTVGDVSGQRLMLGSLAQAPACINAIDVGDKRGDVVMRAMNISPTDYLQIETRKTTMEALYEQYEKYRNKA